MNQEDQQKILQMEIDHMVENMRESNQKLPEMLKQKWKFEKHYRKEMKVKIRMEKEKKKIYDSEIERNKIEYADVYDNCYKNTDILNNTLFNLEYNNRQKSFLLRYKMNLNNREKIDEIDREQRDKVRAIMKDKFNTQDGSITQNDIEMNGKAIQEMIRKSKEGFKDALKELKGKSKELKISYLKNLEDLHKQHFNFIQKKMTKYLQKNDDYTFAYRIGKMRHIKTKTYYNVGITIKKHLGKLN